MVQKVRYSQSPRFGEILMPQLEAVNRSHKVDVYVVSDRVGENQRIGVRISDNPLADATFIRPMPATDEVGRIQLADDQGVYRELSGTRVIGVDFPGMGEGTGPITKLQRDSLKEGSFLEVADAQWDAIGEALDKTKQTYNDLGRIVLWGTSLGGHEVAGMYATKPEDAKVTDLVFQVTPWKTALKGLIRGFAAAAKDRDYYYSLDSENYHGRESDAEWLKRISTKKKLGAVVLAARALSRGKIMEDLTSRSLDGMRVHLMNAEYDLISPTNDNLAALDELHSQKASVEYQLMYGEYHAIQQSRRVVGVQQKTIVDSY